MSEENITRMSLAEANLHKGETDWSGLRSRMPQVWSLK